MKTRAASFLLATLAVVSLVLPALAAEPGGYPEELPVQDVENVETEAVEEPESAIRLDGEPVDCVECEIRGGVCYVTVRSFVSMLDPEAMIEEEDGVVYVSASTVTQVVPVGGDGADGETAEAGWTADVADDDVAAADVVTADLDLWAALGQEYFIANGHHLYVSGGLVDLDGSVAVPVRQLAQVFNLDVGFDSLTSQVLLDHREGAEPYLVASRYDDDTLYWLSRIIFCESGNQPLEGKIAVGNVVMNRVDDPRFPDTLYDVLFQKNQFTPADSSSIYREPNEESMLAAMLVMDGARVTDALFFNSVRARPFKDRTYVTTIGDHAFYK